jgi:hypothetical protein
MFQETILLLICERQKQLGLLKCQQTFTRPYCFSSSKMICFNNTTVNKYDWENMKTKENELQYRNSKNDTLTNKINCMFQILLSLVQTRSWYDAFARRGCYMVQAGSQLLTFWGRPIGAISRCQEVQSFFLDCLAPEDRTNRLSQHISNWLPTYAT